jgi:hypothetical protein
MKLEHVIDKKRTVKLLLSLMLNSNLNEKEREELTMLIFFILDE